MTLDQITATPLDELTADDVAEVLERLKAIEESEGVPVDVARFGSAV